MSPPIFCKFFALVSTNCEIWFEPDFIKFMCNKIPLRPLVFLQIVLTVESHSNSYQIIGYCYREILANTKTCETHAKLLQVAVLRNLFFT